MLPPPPPPRQRLTGRAALRCRYEARCCCCCGRPLPAAALHVPRLGGSSGGGGGGCSRRGGGSTSRAAQPSELLPAFSSPCSPSRPLPAPGFRPRPLLPAPCRRLTRTDTCSPRPRGIRRLVGLLSGAQVAPAALTPARPHARGRPRARAACRGDWLFPNGPGDSPARPRPRPPSHFGVWPRPQYAHLGVWLRCHLGTRPRPRPRFHLLAWFRPRPLSHRGARIRPRFRSHLGENACPRLPSHLGARPPSHSCAGVCLADCWGSVLSPTLRWLQEAWGHSSKTDGQAQRELRSQGI